MPVSLASSSSLLSTWRGTWVNKMLPICVKAFQERSIAVFRREKVERDRITIFERIREIGFSVDDIGQTKIPSLRSTPGYTESPQEVRHLIDKLLKKLKLPSDPRSCLDYLVRVGDLKEDVNVELHKQGFMKRNEFPSQLEELAIELASFNESALPIISGRCDLRHKGQSIAIDRKNTFCVEQAIDFDDEEQRIYVHLPDILSFLDRENIMHQALLNEAKERIKRLHYGDFFSPMFPEKLTNELFSLTSPRKGNYTYAITLVFKILPGGRIGQKLEIIRTIIRTPVRFTPNELNRFMHTSLWKKKKYHDMYEFTRLYLEARYKMSGNDLGMKELSKKTPAEVLVNELMTVVNTLGAATARRNELPYVYRTVRFDDAQFRRRRHSIGYNAESKETSVTAMNTTLNGVPSAVPKPHLDLNVPEYGQLTAPVRSYQCFVNIYQLLHHECNEKLLYTRKDIEKIVNDTLKLDLRERIVNRRLQKFRAYRKLARNISKSETGIILEAGVVQNTDVEYVDRTERKRVWSVFLISYRVHIAAVGPANLDVGTNVYVEIHSVDERTSYVKAIVKSVRKRRPLQEDQDCESSSEGAGSIFQSHNSFRNLSLLGNKKGANYNLNKELRRSTIQSTAGPTSIGKPPRADSSSRVSSNKIALRNWLNNNTEVVKKDRIDEISTPGKELAHWTIRSEVASAGFHSRRSSLTSNRTFNGENDYSYTRRDSSGFRESLTDKYRWAWRGSGKWQCGDNGRQRELDCSWRRPEEKNDGFGDENY